MWVDVTSLIKDTGVGQTIKMTLLPTAAQTDEFGTISDDDAEVIEGIYCTMVEQIDKVVDSNKGSYSSRVTYDFYIPAQYSVGKDLMGATIETEDGRKFTVLGRPINQKYVSHCVVNAKEDKLTYEYGGGF